MLSDGLPTMFRMLETPASPAWPSGGASVKHDPQAGSPKPTSSECYNRGMRNPTSVRRSPTYRRRIPSIAALCEMSRKAATSDFRTSCRVPAHSLASPAGVPDQWRLQTSKSSYASPPRRGIRSKTPKRGARPLSRDGGGQ